MTARTSCRSHSRTLPAVPVFRGPAAQGFMVTSDRIYPCCSSPGETCVADAAISSPLSAREAEVSWCATSLPEPTSTTDAAGTGEAPSEVVRRSISTTRSLPVRCSAIWRRPARISASPLAPVVVSIFDGIVREITRKRQDSDFHQFAKSKFNVPPRFSVAAHHRKMRPG